MSRIGSSIALAVAATSPGLVIRLAGLRVAGPANALAFGVAILGAGFLLSWAAEAAERHVSQGLAIAGLALITVLPEYAVDIYYSLEAGRHPGSAYVQYAAANMTGANRLLVGFAWPLIVLIYRWRGGGRGVELRRENSVEILFLGIATLYSFVIIWKSSIGLLDMAVLLVVFGAYLWRLGGLAEDGDSEGAVGPVAAIARLPARGQYAIIAALAGYAACVILVAAEPFAESLITAGRSLGLNEFLLIQWVAPLASEASQVVITVLFTLRLMPTYALGAVISDKINQWTLLVGMLPLFFSIGAGRASALPLDARQHEEFFLTAAQSLFGVALLLRLRLGVAGSLALLVLFLAQLGLGFAFRHDELQTIRVLTSMAWLYLALAVSLIIKHRNSLIDCVRAGLLARPDADTGGA